MSPEGLLAIVGATVGVLVCLVTLGLSRAPGCRELRWLGAIAVTAGAACALRGLAAGQPDSVILLMTRIGTAFAGILFYAWLRYEASDRPPTRVDRVLAAAALAFGFLSLLPGVTIADGIVRHSDGWSGATYVDGQPTVLGAVGLLGLIAAATTLLVRYVRRWRAHEAGAGANALGLVGLQLAALADTLDGAWLHRWMHVLPVGLIWTIGTIGLALVGRFVDGARSLARLSERLEQAVGDRTTELASARATLVETEQLATLGRLSAALAHEMNNPLAVVAANLAFLREAWVPGSDDTEEQEAFDDTQQSVDRVATIVRQLADAGALATHGGPTVPVPLAAVANAALASAREKVGQGVRIAVEIPSSLHVSTLEASLRQVLTSVVAVAAEAMHAVEYDGRIRIRAERLGERVVLRVEDEAPEQDDLLRERRFRRFLDSRPEAVQGDVGLSVSLALLRMLGARIEVERSGEDGSSVRIDLRAAEAPARGSGAPISSPAARARVLIVDDDVLTRIGLRRLLGREYVIEEAAGVGEALAFAREHRADLDAIVADLVMPDGGAQRLLEELEREAPELAAATLLLTGGAIDEQTSRFLAIHTHRVLHKPLNVAALRALIERFRIRRSGVSARARRDG